MRVVKPGRALVIEIGQRSLLQDCGGLRIFRQHTVRKSGHNLGNTLDEIGWVQPILTQFVQTPRRIGDRDGAPVIGVIDGRDVRRQPFGEGKGLEGAGRRVTRIVADPEPCAKTDCPRLMKPAVKNADCGVIIARSDDQLMVRANRCVDPAKQPMLGNRRRRNVSRPTANRVPHSWPRLNVPPPELSVSLATVLSRSDLT
jgi:hypothetical protein